MDLFGSVNSLCRKIFSYLNVKIGVITFTLPALWKYVMKVAMEFVKSTEHITNSPELNPLDYDVWNEFKQLVYKNQR
jgi:hypothetical protein